jgi:hypothetical protein
MDAAQRTTSLRSRRAFQTSLRKTIRAGLLAQSVPIAQLLGRHALRLKQMLAYSSLSNADKSLALSYSAGNIRRMKPSIGRVVHYWPDQEEPLAAIITALADDFVSLCVFGATGIEFLDAEYADKPEEGKWTWPKREE